MDDRNFDDFIKGKLDGYEDPSLDPAALADFHEKLTAFQPMPWYELHLSQYMMAASIALFTIVNAYLFWPAGEESKVTGSDKNTYEQVVVDSLNQVIHELRQTYSITSHHLDSALAINSKLAPNQISGHSQKEGPGVYLGMTSEIPEDVYHALLVKKMLITEDGQAYLVSPEKSNDVDGSLAQLNVKEVGSDYPWPQVGLPPYELTNKPIVVTAVSKPMQNTISNKMRTVLEKHYSKGIGINIAPHADLAKGVFSNGTGAVTPRFGVDAEWVLSPGLSVTTGLDYSTTSLRTQSVYGDLNLPPPDPNLGEVESVQIKNTLLSLPLGIKYRHWISEKGQAFVKLGYTPYMTIAQEYEYTYDFDRGPGAHPILGLGPNPNPDHHHVTSVQKYSDRYYYGGTGTGSVGITKLMNNNNKIEASLFYEKSLANVSQENLGMQLFGLRTAFWFNLR